MSSPSTPTAVPRVSMVLPVHNGADYLGAAVQSVLDQHFSDFELICVDDGSSDASPDILADFAARDARVRVVTLRPNVGLPAALNLGFAVARGDYHSWTSDDNLLRPAMLARLVAALDANPDIGVVHSGYQVIDPDGTPVDQVAVGPADQLLMGNNIGASFLYRRAVTDALGGYDETLFGAEDYDFWLRAQARFGFLAVAEDLYQYRKHPRSLTNQRAATIQRLVTRSVLAALPGDAPNRERAAVLLSLVTRNHFVWRGDLYWRALLADPAQALAAAPAALRQLARAARAAAAGRA